MQHRSLVSAVVTSVLILGSRLGTLPVTRINHVTGRVKHVSDSQERVPSFVPFETGSMSTSLS